jgi:AraC family transcriptional regulator of adaptative response/methylated-DNA-[protein]-cysteine methyltransferase
MNDRYRQKLQDYSKIEQIITFLVENNKSQPSLDEIAEFANLSKFHLQRTFKRLVGISPTQFLQFLTLEQAKRLLFSSKGVLDTSLDLGLSGPSRLHDLFVAFEGITPGEFKRNCAGLKISYAFFDTPLGRCQIAASPRGICLLAFTKEKDDTNFIQLLASCFTRATFLQNQQDLEMYLDKMFLSMRSNGLRPFYLSIKGTNLQVNVWRALLATLKESEVTDQEKAALLRKSNDGSTVRNPEIIDYLIPCHRVISKLVCCMIYRTPSIKMQETLVK